jgi:hypothetical protein
MSIIVGRKDRVTPVETNARRYARLIRGAELTVLPGNVRYMTFGSECTALGKQMFEGCRDGEGVGRAAEHRYVEVLAYRFFERVFAGK